MFINDPKVIEYGVAMLIAYMISGPVIGIKTRSFTVSNVISFKCVRWALWSDLWTGTDRLYCSDIIYNHMAAMSK